MRVVCRVHDAAGEEKARPAWFSRERTLASLIRAAHEAAAPLLFLTDGPIRASLVGMLRDAGAVEPISRGGSARRSYRAMLRRAAQGLDDGFVWFAEDDYLYRPDALVHVAEAARDADYVTVVGSAARDLTSSRWTPRAHTAPGAPAADGEPTWFPAMATTSTFGVHGRVLREDLRTLTLVPFAGGAWDTTTSLVLAGLRPFERRGLLSQQGSLVRDRSGRIVETAPADPEPLRRVMARAGARLALSTLALRGPSRRRVLLAPDPELARHVEDGVHRSVTSPATAAYDWAGLAERTREWTEGG